MLYVTKQQKRKCLTTMKMNSIYDKKICFGFEQDDDKRAKRFATFTKQRMEKIKIRLEVAFQVEIQTQSVNTLEWA